MNFMLLSLFSTCIFGALALKIWVKHKTTQSEPAVVFSSPPKHRPLFARRKRRVPSETDFLDASLMLELLATMQETGLPLSTSLQRLAELGGRESATLSRVAARLSAGLNWNQAWEFGGPLSPEVAKLKDALAVVSAVGAPSADILRATAARTRRTEFRRAEQAAAQLGVKLVVPLGVCSLPAFICLGVVPVLIALIPASFGN